MDIVMDGVETGDIVVSSSSLFDLQFVILRKNGPDNWQCGYQTHQTDPQRAHCTVHARNVCKAPHAPIAAELAVGAAMFRAK